MEVYKYFTSKHGDLPKLLKQMKLDKVKSQLAKIKTYLFREGIKMNYEIPVKSSQIIKIVCTAYDYASIFDSMVRECNGAIYILGTLGWTMKVIPLPFLFKKTDDKNIIDNIKNDKYLIYPMVDATLINIYYLNSKWHISSSRSYDLREYKINGHYCKDMLEECLTEKKVDDFWGCLNKKACYTFLIRNPKVHIFTSTYDIQFVRYVEMDNYKHKIRVFTDTPHQQIDHYNVLDINDLPKFAEEFETKNANAFDTYCKTGEQHFGYILRSKNPRKAPDIKLESTLMAAIRKLVYDSTYTRMATNYDIGRNYAVLINAFIGKNSPLATVEHKFLTLFPTYKPIFDNITTITNKVITHVVTNKYFDEEGLKPLNGVKDIIYKSMKKITSMNTVTTKLVSDFLISYKSFSELYTICKVAQTYKKVNE